MPERKVGDSADDETGTGPGTHTKTVENNMQMPTDNDNSMNNIHGINFMTIIYIILGILHSTGKCPHNGTYSVQLMSNMI